MLYTCWVFYSVAHSLPELYLHVVDYDSGIPIKDPTQFLAQTELLTDKRSLIITQKEHPVLPGRVVWYIHECRMPEVFKEMQTTENIVMQWISMVMPSVLGIEGVVSLEMA